MPRKPASRFIAPQARAGNGHGYLNQPMRPLPDAIDPIHNPDDAELLETIASATRHCDEPEAIGPAIVDAITELARTYDRIRYSVEVETAQQARRLLTMEQRMADVQRRAKLRHADVSGEMHVIKAMLERARKGGRVDPSAATERIERIEARLDYRHDLERDAA
jgi:hypothetical protein